MEHIENTLNNAESSFGMLSAQLDLSFDVSTSVLYADDGSLELR